MNQQIELFIILTIILYSLSLLLPCIEKIIDFIGKCIISIIKYLIKTFIQIYIVVLFFLWICILFLIFYDMINHFMDDNFQISNQVIKNITTNNFERIIGEKNL
jgi:flagellar biosynthesis protein FlhB